MMGYFGRSYGVAYAAPVAAALYYCFVLMTSYSRLANSIAIHYGIDGKPNGWMSKTVWSPLSVVAIFALIGLFAFVTRSPNAANIDQWTTVLVYAACFGLVIGSFLQLLYAGLPQGHFRFGMAFLWPLGLVFVEGVAFALIKK